VRTARKSGALMSTNEKIKVFLIEDNDDDAALLSRSLAKEQDIRFEVERATSLTAGLEGLGQGKYDIILTDLKLPDSIGLTTFFKVHAEFPDIPIIVLTGLMDEKSALETVQQGAQDYLIKGQITGKSLVRVIRYSLERHLLLARLEKSLKEIRTLRGLLPICAWCKNIRDDKGYWKNVESYISENTDAVFTHGICPACAAKLKKQPPDSKS
jgi:DNA-binding NtrC family response regulator